MKPLLLLALWPVLGAQQPPAPVKPAQLPADWAQRDLEGKWVAWRAALDAGANDTTVAAAWALALGEAKEFELLEQIAIFAGWRLAGPQLAKAEAPQLLRVALWNLGALDSHDKDTARNALLQRGPLVLGWLRAHPGARLGKGAPIVAELEKANVQPAEAAAFLAPLDPVQVLVPLLDAPAAIVEFGDRLRAEGRTRYVHQVLRGLSGVAVFGATDDLIVHKVVALTRHPHAAIASAAFTALSKLPGAAVPYEPLRRIVDDAAADPGRRRLAAMAFSFSAHPAAFFRLHEIARDPAHPASDVAIARLGEIGDPATEADLQGFAVADLERGKRIGAALAAIGRRRQAKDFLQAGPLAALLLRAGWLAAANDPRAEGYAADVEHLLRSQAGGVELDGWLDPYRAGVAPSPLRGEEAQRVDAAIGRLVARLLQPARAPGARDK